MQAEERFLAELAGGIIFAGGSARFTQQSGLALAREVWAELRRMGTDTYPAMLEREELRFVYQWDESPQVITVMLWDDVMWQDMARVEIPPELEL
ncbi:MAG: hypothetical protein ACOY93_23120 [Bacillota bacterium]